MKRLKTIISNNVHFKNSNDTEDIGTNNSTGDVDAPISDELPRVDIRARCVNILGTTWTIRYGTVEDYPMLALSDGYADSSVKDIIIDDMSDVYDNTNHKKDLEDYRRHVVRHEVIHAFLIESGLDSCSMESEHWADNEEMVDWMATQTPKIYKAFEELGVLS